MKGFSPPTTMSRHPYNATFSYTSRPATQTSLKNSSQFQKPGTAIKQQPMQSRAQLPRPNIQVLMYRQQPSSTFKEIQEKEPQQQPQPQQHQQQQQQVLSQSQAPPIVIPQLIFGQGRLMHGVQTARTIVTGAENPHFSGRVSEVEISRQVITNPNPPLSKKNTLVSEVDPRPEYEMLREMYRTLEERFGRLEREVGSSDRQQQPREATRSQKDIEELVSARIQEELLSYQEQINQREQLIAQYEQNLEYLGQQNKELLETNRQYQQQLKSIVQNLSKQSMRTTLQQTDKQPKIQGALTSRSPKQDIYREVNDLKKHIDVLQAEIQRCNSQILKKNAQLLQLRNTSMIESQVSAQLKAAEFQKTRMQQLLRQKSIQITNMKSQQMTLTIKAEQASKLQQILRQTQQQLRHLDEDYRVLELNSKRQALNLEASNASILELAKQKDKLQEQLKKAEEEAQKERMSSRQNQFDLESVMREKEREYQGSMDSMRESIGKANQFRQNFIKAEAQMQRQLESLQRESQEEKNMLLGKLEEVNGRNNELQAKNGEYQRRLVEESQKAKLVLEEKQKTCSGQVKSLKSQNQNLKIRIQDLQSQLQQQSKSLDHQRSQIDKRVKKYRQQLQQSYLQTINSYQQKISQLQKKKTHTRTNYLKDKTVKQKHERAKSIQKQNARLRNIVGRIIEYNQNIEQFCQGLGRFQQHLAQSQQLARKPIVLGNLQTSQQSLLSILTSLRQQLHKFHSLKTISQCMSLSRTPSSNSLAQQNEQNFIDRILQGCTYPEQKVEALSAEVTRLRNKSRDYEGTISYLQKGSVHVLSAASLHSRSKSKEYEQNIGFYKQANRELSDRFNTVMQANIVMKEELAKLSCDYTQLIRQKQQLIQKQLIIFKKQLQSSVHHLQSQLKTTQSKSLQHQKSFQSKISSLQTIILDQNLKLSMAAHQKMILQVKNLQMNNKIKHLQSDNQWLKGQYNEIQSKMKLEEDRLVELQVRNRELEREVMVVVGVGGDGGGGAGNRRVEYRELMTSRDNRDSYENRERGGHSMQFRLNLGSPKERADGDLRQKCMELESKVAELSNRLELQVKNRQKLQASLSQSGNVTQRAGQSPLFQIPHVQSLQATPSSPIIRDYTLRSPQSIESLLSALTTFFKSHKPDPQKLQILSNCYSHILASLEKLEVLLREPHNTQGLLEITGMIKQVLIEVRNYSGTLVEAVEALEGIRPMVEVLL